jgi:hypothetical protein
VVGVVGMVGVVVGPGIGGPVGVVLDRVVELSPTTDRPFRDTVTGRVTSTRAWVPVAVPFAPLGRGAAASTFYARSCLPDVVPLRTTGCWCSLSRRP